MRGVQFELLPPTQSAAANRTTLQVRDSRTCACAAGCQPGEALRLGTCFGQQLVPGRRWVAAVEHAAEHPAGIVGASVCPLGVLVVDPGKYDHLGLRVEPEEQPVLLEELGPEPMLVLVAALPRYQGQGGSRRVGLSPPKFKRTSAVGCFFLCRPCWRGFPAWPRMRQSAQAISEQVPRGRGAGFPG